MFRLFTHTPSPLPRYDNGAGRAAEQIIAAYSTSFSLASQMLSPQTRTDIRNLYAVVRIADEIVDGAAAAAGLSPQEVQETLDAYEQAVLQAPHRRFHTDPILHSYGLSARRCGFKDEHIQAFFASMRRDLHQSVYSTAAELNQYVYGSAEVIGLLCLDAFLVGQPVSSAQRRELEAGARRLGAAFQKVNFLRDLGADTGQLGRSYFPQAGSAGLSAESKDELITDIRADLAAARAVMDQLPLTARAGVIAATDLFEALTNDIAALPARALPTKRVSVSIPRKLALLLRATVKSLRRTR